MKKIILAATMAVALLATTMANANTISLTATSGTTLTGTIVAPGEDQISFGTLNGWSFSVIGGTTFPASGTAAAPYLDLNTVLITGIGAGNLVITFSGTDYTGIGGAKVVVQNSTLTGTFQAYGGSSDLINDETHALLGSPITLSTSPQTVLGLGVLGTSPNPYSLTEVLTITGGAPGSLDSILTEVPDGGLTMTMLGTALVGLQILRRKVLC